MVEWIRVGMQGLRVTIVDGSPTNDGVISVGDVQDITVRSDV